ncbi:hypothetical protein JP09_010220 [Dehalogenimonas etheniformans]|uniref:HEAT repeat domain-containing protein n=2 Tax=Dehalogenimonas etheniformans TaxID=1536648 RepID=A0A2P5P4N0_9CHLR|nr:hypothetical protein JP09_010220 [Dehalogenimonas etheniformans]
MITRNKNSDQSRLEQADSDPSIIPELISIMNSKGTDRFRAAKELSLIARDAPELLYPEFNIFADLLDNQSSVLLWNGLRILGYVARVDTQHRLDGVIDKYLSHLWDKKLVTAANVVLGAGQILKYRPELANKILNQILQVDEIPLPTDECHQVIRGHVLSAFIDGFESLGNDARIFEFAQRCSQSGRPSTMKKSEELIRKMQPG